MVLCPIGSSHFRSNLIFRDKRESQQFASKTWEFASVTLSRKLRLETRRSSINRRPRDYARVLGSKDANSTAALWILAANLRVPSNAKYLPVLILPSLQELPNRSNRLGQFENRFGGNRAWRDVIEEKLFHYSRFKAGCINFTELMGRPRNTSFRNWFQVTRASNFSRVTNDTLVSSILDELFFFLFSTRGNKWFL